MTIDLPGHKDSKVVFHVQSFCSAQEEEEMENVSIIKGVKGLNVAVNWQHTFLNLFQVNNIGLTLNLNAFIGKITRNNACYNAMHIYL